MYTFTDQFISNEKNAAFLKATMMGPNAMRVTEELTSHLEVNEGMRVLDLGCGSGLSALLLAKKFGASVFAADLWVSPTENYQRFKSLGIDDKIVPISADATKGLPFADEYFDLLVSVDAYHYFGGTPEMLSSLTRFVKKGGCIAVAMSGLKYEFGEKVPEEMKPFWIGEEARTIHSLDWWKKLWSAEKGIRLLDVREMRCCGQAWQEWLGADHPMIAHDVEMMRAEGGNYFCLVQMIAKVL